MTPGHVAPEPCIRRDGAPPVRFQRETTCPVTVDLWLPAQTCASTPPRGQRASDGLLIVTSIDTQDELQVASSQTVTPCEDCEDDEEIESVSSPIKQQDLFMGTSAAKQIGQHFSEGRVIDMEFQDYPDRCCTWLNIMTATRSTIQRSRLVDAWYTMGVVANLPQMPRIASR